DRRGWADCARSKKLDGGRGEEAGEDGRRQVQRNRQAFAQRPEDLPVYGTIAARFNDDGVTALYQAVAARLREKGLKLAPGMLPKPAAKISSGVNLAIPAKRTRYLAEVAGGVRGYRRHAREQAGVARERASLIAARRMLQEAGKDGRALDPLIEEKSAALDARSQSLLDEWPATVKAYS